jgi:hypothetical protein
MKRILLIVAALCSFLPTIGMDNRIQPYNSHYNDDFTKDILRQNLREVVYNQNVGPFVEEQQKRDPKNPASALVQTARFGTPPAAKKIIYSELGFFDNPRVTEKAFNTPIHQLLLDLSRVQRITATTKIPRALASSLKEDELDHADQLCKKFGEANTREIAVTRDKFWKTQQLPDKVLKRFVVPGKKGEADQLLYVKVPSTLRDNVERVGAGAFGGAAIGVLSTLPGSLLAQGIENNIKTAMTKTTDTVKEAALIKGTQVAKTYVQDIFNPDALKAIKTEVVMKAIENGPHDLGENPCAMDALAGKTGYEYARQVTGKIQDSDRAAAHFTEVKDFLIKTGKEAFSEEIQKKELWFNRESYTKGLTQQSVLRSMAYNGLIGCALGTCHGLWLWGKDVTPSTAIRHINNEGGKDHPSTSPLFSANDKRNQS